MTLFRIITSAALPVLLAIVFDLLEKRTKWQTKPYAFKQGIIGICFGGLAVLAASKRKGYQQEDIILRPGDELFLYTDGVTEATNAHDELYGEGRLLRFLNSLGELPMEEVCARVKADVYAFVGDAPQFDDITMLGFRYMGGDGCNVTTNANMLE